MHIKISKNTIVELSDSGDLSKMKDKIKDQVIYFVENLNKILKMPSINVNGSLEKDVFTIYDIDLDNVKESRKKVMLKTVFNCCEDKVENLKLSV
jgi:hypothetical protein